MWVVFFLNSKFDCAELTNLTDSVSRVICTWRYPELRYYIIVVKLRRSHILRRFHNIILLLIRAHHNAALVSRSRERFKKCVYSFQTRSPNVCICFEALLSYALFTRNMSINLLNYCSRHVRSCIFSLCIFVDVE